jgi:Arc/MetJ-type ribon-helix-helix transcriptional regulator
MDLSRNPEEKLKGAGAPAPSSAFRETAPSQGHSDGEHKATTSTPRCPHTKAVRVNLSEGLNRDIELIVENLGLWPSLNEFIRDAIRKERDCRIDEAVKAKDQLEEGAHDPRRSNDPGQEEGEAT